MFVGVGSLPRRHAVVELPGRHLPPRHARLLQGRPVPRRRLGDARASAARATSCAWAACKQVAAAHALDLPHLLPGDRRHLPVRRLLVEGRDPRRRHRRHVADERTADTVGVELRRRQQRRALHRPRPLCSTRSAARRRLHRVLHVPPLLPRLRRRVPRRPHEQEHHLHESPPAMTVVLWILAAGSIAASASSASPTSSGRAHDLLRRVALAGAAAAGARGDAARVRHASRSSRSACRCSASASPGCSTATASRKRVRNFVASRPAPLQAGLQQVLRRRDLRPRWSCGRCATPPSSCGRRSTPSSSTCCWSTASASSSPASASCPSTCRTATCSATSSRVIVGGAVIVGVGTHYDVWAGAKFDAQVQGHEVQVTAHGAGPTAKRLQYRVDWDGDGKYSATQMPPTFTPHATTRPGRTEISVEAIDPRWGTVSRESHTVKVQ